ncbi:hypothetical protein GWI33_021447 [Rhynchophorus ferrugineus]|uniref:Kelch-like protein diablo n=1 Tax=Rhynchophorus ferrugineus TaxID=354439 RepID=A0A834IRU8_RHYFE|nr:hypothetical protein GWI33_021447 [Rhynchophorus ferrugineus]
MNISMKLRTSPIKRKQTTKFSINKSSLNKRKRQIGKSRCKVCCCSVKWNAEFDFPKIWEELRNENQLCDGIVRCQDGVVFNIHRIILSAVSPYFRALFTNSINRDKKDIKESNLGISSQTFRIILDYAYTGRCAINKSNVFDILKYADQYGIISIVQKCCRFLLDDLSPTNCLQILKFATQYFCNKLIEQGNRYVLQHFGEVLLKNECFCDLSGPLLVQILSDDYLNVKSEEVVFQAVQKWINFNISERKVHLLELLKCIRMGNLSYGRISKIAHWPLLQTDSACTLYITDILTIINDVKEVEIDPLNTYLSRPRIPYDIVFSIGGWSSGSPTSFIETYDNRADRWLISDKSDVVARAYHGMCTYMNNIYLVGGFDGNEYFNTVRCFNPSNHTWSDCACMYYSRCYVSVVLCAGKIYAMGGYNGRIRMSSVERYDPLRNQWELIPSMQKQRSDACAAVLNNKIYIVGGFNGQEVMNSGEMYDPLVNQWTYIPPMISARSGVSLIAYSNSLYAIGGFNGYTRLPTMEKFTPDLSTNPGWIEISEMLTPRSNFGTVILDGCIYVIGGFNGSTTVNYVEYYDVDLDEWMEAASMNLNRSALSACVISGLPNSKDYSILHYKPKEPQENDEG